MVRNGSLAENYYFEFDSASGGFSSDARTMILGEAAKWMGADRYDRALQMADDDHPANATIKRTSWPDKSIVFGRVLFDGVKAPRAADPDAKTFAIDTGKWGVMFRDSLTTSLVSGSDPLRERKKFMGVTLHEMGHLIGLGHVPKECAASKTIMTIAYEPGRSPTDLTERDIIATQRLISSRGSQ